MGKKLQKWQQQGPYPLAVALLGIDQLPPLWAHPTGSIFVRGSKFVARPHVAEQRKLTHMQVLLLQCLWTPEAMPHPKTIKDQTIEICDMMRNISTP